MSIEQLKTGDKINMFRDRSPDAVALDNLIRKTLRVSDPGNAVEMAQALRNYYTTDNEYMAREAAGLPFVSAPVQAASPQVATSTSAEVKQAVSDVERDLAALTTNSILKDIEPELRGWATAVRQGIAGGIHSARFALDPRQRDSAFAARRLLGNYARMARAVGTLKPAANSLFRSFARSIDEVAAVMLVLIGESLASSGIGGGKFILQAPVSEIQARRDAVIYSLRNLVGSTQDAYGPNEWPRGLQAYQQLMEKLGNNAQHDLRALLQENELAELMDELIHLAVGNTADGYRALGSTATIELERLNRLIMIGQDLVDPKSPPLESFLMSLRLFKNAFDNGRQGYRLMTIARPPILFYGLYGMEQDPVSRDLLNLIISRGRLAEELDCCRVSKVQNNTDEEEIQLCLDKILYDIDRTIDLYALGTKDSVELEQRTFAYGYFIAALINDYKSSTCKQTDNCPTNECPVALDAGNCPYRIKHIKNDLFKKLPAIAETDESKKITFQELWSQKTAEESYVSLLQAMAPSCFDIVSEDKNPVIRLIMEAIKLLKLSDPVDTSIPPHYEMSLDTLASHAGEINSNVDEVSSKVGTVGSEVSSKIDAVKEAVEAVIPKVSTDVNSVKEAVEKVDKQVDKVVSNLSNIADMVGYIKDKKTRVTPPHGSSGQKPPGS